MKAWMIRVSHPFKGKDNQILLRLEEIWVTGPGNHNPSEDKAREELQLRQTCTNKLKNLCLYLPAPQLWDPLRSIPMDRWSNRLLSIRKFFKKKRSKNVSSKREIYSKWIFKSSLTKIKRQISFQEVFSLKKLWIQKTDKLCKILDHKINFRAFRTNLLLLRKRV